MDNITLNTHYTRSIHLERDANSTDILSAYIPTTRALQTLADIADTLNTESMPRAWSLIGAYGSGKSSFASFLVQLFSRENHKLAQQKLNLHIEHTTGYCAVLLTGSPESLSKRLVHALYLGAKHYFSSHPIIATLEQATQKHQDTSQIIELLKQLQQAVIEQQGQGILIIIDELGKFLEYEARHHSTNDIFLLQAIAELAYQGSKANILLVVLMHQAFEHYAKGLSEKTKNEWLKIQGRFQHISFLESTEQTLRVMSAAFSNQLPDQQKQQIKQNTQKIVQTLAEQNALYSGLSVETATDILANCYPLHPIAALILPVLCQKVAQNERTLFSYLGSSEQYGFKDSLSRANDWIQPWEIFQYFIQNQPLATTDHLTHRRWAEVITAMDRLGDSDDLEIQLLKTIGLFNIMGSQSGFKACHALLKCCFQDLSALTQLEQKSIITYRKYNSEYRIWQGSDFDINLALQETKQQQARFNLAEILEKRNKLPPILARRYSIQNNLIRYFQPHYANAETNINSFDKYQAKLIFFLAETDQDKEKFDTIKTQGDNLTLYLLCDNANQLRNIISDAIALETIQNERPEIKDDPVAQTELKAYLQAIQQQEKELLSDYLENPENYIDWHYHKTQCPINNKRHLQNKLSSILDEVYDKAPLIKNELINRQKPSGQANAAKNKLITALLTNIDSEDLGFEKDKYPPEKTIYQAIFKATGIHKKPTLQRPTDYNFHYVWNAIDKFLANKNTPQPLTNIYQLLEKPPYGVQAGVLSLLFIAYYLSNQRTLALYESGVFCPNFTPELFEILNKRPELFSVESVNLTGIKAELFNGYLEKLLGKVQEDNTLLDIIKPLAKFINNLPEYTRHSKNLSAETIAVRDAFQNTQSPVKLLFETLPIACGFESYLEQQTIENPEKFLDELVKHLNILNRHYSDLLDEFQKQLTSALKEPENITLSELRAVIKQKYNLEKYSNDTQGLKAFIKRLCDNQNSDKTWLESVASFLGNVSPNKWRQNNQITAEYRLCDFSDRLLQLALIHSHQLEGDITVIRIFKKQGETNQVIYPNEQKTQQAKQFIADKFKDIDPELRLTIVNELLNM